MCVANKDQVKLMVKKKEKEEEWVMTKIQKAS